MAEQKKKSDQKYATTHDIDYNLALKLLNNGELIYDDLTKSITMNMNLIESSDADNSTVQAVKTNFKVPPALKERLLATKVKNNNVQKYLRLSDDELAKLWLCRAFIFGTDLSVTPKSNNARTDTEFTLASSSNRCIGAHGDVEDVSNQDTDAVIGKRSVD